MVEIRRGFVIVQRSLYSFGRDRCAAHAAAMAYYTVLTLFPLALVAVAILGLFLSDVSARVRVVETIREYLPLGTQGEEALLSTLEGVSATSGLIALVGLLVTIWSASGLFAAFRRAMDAVWDVDRPLPFLRGKLRDLALLFSFGGLLVLSTTISGVLHGTLALNGRWPRWLPDPGQPLSTILAVVAPVMLTFGALLVLYRYAPHARLSWRAIWPAALLATVFFETGKDIVVYIMITFGGANAITGAIGSIIFLLIFLSWAMQVILFAAEIAKHRLLVNAGALPPTDPLMPLTDVPPMLRLRWTVARLWSVDIPHHDTRLPYAPARLVPHAHGPDNTRESVLVRNELARAEAARLTRRALALAAPAPDQLAGTAIPHAANGRDGRTGDTNPPPGHA